MKGTLTPAVNAVLLVVTMLKFAFYFSAVPPTPLGKSAAGNGFPASFVPFAVGSRTSVATFMLSPICGKWERAPEIFFVMPNNAGISSLLSTG